MDPLPLVPAAARKRKPLDMAAEAVAARAETKAKKEHANRARNETDELLESMSELFEERIEDIITKDNKHAFEVVLRNRNHKDLKSNLSDEKLVELIFTHDASRCMTKLQPFDKYNAQDHLQRIDVALVMDPTHRDIVAGFLWSRNANVLSYEWNGNQLVGGQEKQRITDTQFRTQSIVRLLQRPKTSLTQRLSFFKDMLQRMPYEKVGKPEVQNHPILFGGTAPRQPSKHEKMLKALWHRTDRETVIRGNAEDKLLGWTTLEAMEDEWLEISVDRLTGFDPGEEECGHIVECRKVLQDRASQLHRTVDHVLRGLGFEEAHLPTLICSYLNSQIDPEVHLGAKKHPPLHGRGLFKAARAEVKARKAAKKAAAAVPVAMEIVD